MCFLKCFLKLIAWVDAWSHWLHWIMRSCIGCIFAFIRLFSTMHVQMCPQIAFLRRGIVSFVAFVWLLPTMYFQMSPQIVFLNGCIVTLVAFVWLFSTVHFQMSPKVAFPNGCIVALVAFFYFSPLCIFKCLLKSPFWTEAWSHWLHLFYFLHCIFWTDAYLPKGSRTKSSFDKLGILSQPAWPLPQR